MATKLTRRAVLAGAPAVAAVAVLPAFAVEHEPLLALWAEYQRVNAEGHAINREYRAAEARLPMKWQPHRGKGPVVAPAFMSEADQADRKAAFRRVGLDEIAKRSDAHSGIVLECEKRVLTTMPTTVAGAAIVARAAVYGLEVGVSWCEEIAIENLAVWLEQQAGCAL